MFGTWGGSLSFPCIAIFSEYLKILNFQINCCYFFLVIVLFNVVLGLLRAQHTLSESFLGITMAELLKSCCLEELDGECSGSILMLFIRCYCPVILLFIII
jgi:hypothetical protein